MSEKSPLPQLTDASLLRTKGFEGEAAEALMDGPALMKRARTSMRRARIHEVLGRTDAAGAHDERVNWNLVHAASLVEDGLADFDWEDYKDLAEAQVWLATWENLPSYNTDVTEMEVLGFSKSDRKRENLLRESEANYMKAAQAAPDSAYIQARLKASVSGSLARQAGFRGNTIGASIDIEDAASEISEAEEYVGQMGLRRYGHLMLVKQVRVQSNHIRGLAEERALAAAA